MCWALYFVAEPFYLKVYVLEKDLLNKIFDDFHARQKLFISFFRFINQNSEKIFCSGDFVTSGGPFSFVAEIFCPKVYVLEKNLLNKIFDDVNARQKLFISFFRFIYQNWEKIFSSGDFITCVGPLIL